jgi:hypothetical protein
MTEVVYDQRGMTKSIKEQSPDEKIRDAHSLSESAWKSLGALSYYKIGTMMGNTDGPDAVSVYAVLERVSSLISELIKTSYTEHEKNVPKELLDAFSSVCKAVSALETNEVYVLKIKLLAAFSGLADAFASTCDPEMVRNLSMVNEQQ